MPRKKTSSFTRIKRGRNHDGKGCRGFGHGGWKAQLIDVEGSNNVAAEHSNQISSSPHPVGTSTTSLNHAQPSVLHSIDDIKVEELQITSYLECLPSTPDDIHSLIPFVHERLCFALPESWICMCDSEGVTILLLSRDVEKTIQRQMHFSYCGNVSFSIHRKKFPKDIAQMYLTSVVIEPLERISADDFVTNVVSLVHELRRYEICVGCDRLEYEKLWANDTRGFVDMNPYAELRYKRTFRSNDCKLLTIPSKWRCIMCYRLSENLRRRYKSHCSNFQVNTPNIHLSADEKLLKLASLQKCLQSKQQVIRRLKNKLKNI